MALLRRLYHWLNPYAWRCCDWCDHDRCNIDKTKCKHVCPHIGCLPYEYYN